MTDRRHPLGTIAVEDISVEPAELPSDDPNPASRHPWRLVGAIAVVLLVAAAVAVGATGGSDEMSGPTTAPGPIRVATADDRRALLDAPGWQLTSIDEVAGVA